MSYAIFFVNVTYQLAKVVNSVNLLAAMDSWQMSSTITISGLLLQPSSGDFVESVEVRDGFFSDIPWTFLLNGSCWRLIKDT